MCVQLYICNVFLLMGGCAGAQWGMVRLVSKPCRRMHTNQALEAVCQQLLAGSAVGHVPAHKQRGTCTQAQAHTRFQ